MNSGGRRVRALPRAGPRGAVDCVMQYLRSMAIAAALMTAAGFSVPAEAGDHGDAALAGVAGFAVGTLFGHAAARPRYYTPAPVYVAPPPPVVYSDPRLLCAGAVDARLVRLLRAEIRELRSRAPARSWGSTATGTCAVEHMNKGAPASPRCAPQSGRARRL